MRLISKPNAVYNGQLFKHVGYYEHQRTPHNKRTSNILPQKNAKLAKRIHGVCLASKGLTCPEIVNITGAARRTIQQWIQKYNEHVINGLKDRAQPGKPTKLSRKKELRFRRRIEAGPTKADGVSVLNGPVIRRILEREFGILYSRQGLYDLLHRLGYSCLCPRSRHENADP